MKPHCLQQPRDLLGAQDHRDLTRLTHESEVSRHLGSVEGHGEEEAQRRNRPVDTRRPYAGLRLVQLEAPKVLHGCRQVKPIDLVSIDIHPQACLTSLIILLRCRQCGGHGPLPKLRGLSRFLPVVAKSG
jgi:hypothetical protein